MLCLFHESTASSSANDTLGENDPTEIQLWVQQVGISSITENQAIIVLNPPLLELINVVCLHRIIGAYGEHYLGNAKHLLQKDPTMSGAKKSKVGSEQHTYNAAGEEPKNFTGKSPAAQKEFPSYKVWYGSGMKLLKRNILNAARESDQIWNELESFGSSLEDNRQFVTRYLSKANGHAHGFIDKHLEQDIEEANFKTEITTRYIHILKSFNDFEEGISDKVTLFNAVIDRSKTKIFKSYDSSQYGTFKDDVSSHCLNHETRMLPNKDHSCIYRHNTSESVIPPVRRLLKRQIGAIIATLSATILGYVGGYTSSNSYSRQQIASLTKVLDEQQSDLVSLEHLVRAEFAISQGNFLELTESLGKLFDLVAQAKMLIKVEWHEIMCNTFVAHMSQAAREISRFLSQVKEIFQHGLNNRFPGHLLNEKETRKLLKEIKRQATKKGLELFDDSKAALFGSTCHLGSHQHQFFLLCTVPLKSKNIVKVHFIPSQQILIGKTVLSLNLEAKYIFSDGSMYRTMTEDEFFRNCRTLATEKLDYVSCKSKPNTFYTREQPKDSQSCAYRIVNGILADLTSFCPFTIVPNQSEYVEQLSDSKYLITPLQGEIIVSRFCSSNNKDYQKSVSEPTLMELEPGCRIFAPKHAMGEADLVAGEVKEFQISGTFREMVHTSIEVFEQLGSFESGEQFFENVNKAEIVPKLNTSLPFKELDKLITHSTIEHKAKQIGFLALPSFTTNIFLLVSLFLFTVLILTIRRKWKRRNESKVPQSPDEAASEPLALTDDTGRLTETATISEIEPAPIIRPRPGRPIQMATGSYNVLETPKRRKPDREEK